MNKTEYTRKLELALWELIRRWPGERGYDVAIGEPASFYWRPPAQDRTTMPAPWENKENTPPARPASQDGSTISGRVQSSRGPRQGQGHRALRISQGGAEWEPRARGAG
jgi:hypothetical protein